MAIDIWSVFYFTSRAEHSNCTGLLSIVYACEIMQKKTADEFRFREYWIKVYILLKKNTQAMVTRQIWLLKKQI